EVPIAPLEPDDPTGPVELLEQATTTAMSTPAPPKIGHVVRFICRAQDTRLAKAFFPASGTSPSRHTFGSAPSRHRGGFSSNESRRVETFSPGDESCSSGRADGASLGDAGEDAVRGGARIERDVPIGAVQRGRAALARGLRDVV